MYEGFSFGPVLIFLAAISAVVGWALIESVIWLFSHIDVTWISP
jgi:hypothetical protein